MSGPMGEKANMYGLRVAWCVFGDVKEVLAKDIFVRGSQAGYSAPSTSDEDEHLEHVEVAQSNALSPPPPRSRLQRERSFVWDVQGPLITPDLLSNDHVDADADVAHFDALDSDTESDSEYSDASDEDTESAESDLDLDLSLDDEEEVQRDIMALLNNAEHDGDKTMDGDTRWDMMSFLL